MTVARSWAAPAKAATVVQHDFCSFYHSKNHTPPPPQALPRAKLRKASIRVTPLAFPCVVNQFIDNE